VLAITKTQISTSKNESANLCNTASRTSQLWDLGWAGIVRPTCVGIDCVPALGDDPGWETGGAGGLSGLGDDLSFRAKGWVGQRNKRTRRHTGEGMEGGTSWREARRMGYPWGSSFRASDRARRQSKRGNVEEQSASVGRASVLRVRACASLLTMGFLSASSPSAALVVPATASVVWAPSLRPSSRGRVSAATRARPTSGASRLRMQEQKGKSSAEENATLDSKIFAIALPAVGSLAIDPLLSVVDTLYVGRIEDAAPLAALGVCSSVFNFAFFIFNFFATATTPLVSRAMAAGESDKAIKTLSQAFTAALVIGLLSAGVIEAFAPTILNTMGTSPSAFGDAEGYLRVRALATPAVLLASVANGAFRGVKDTTTPLKILVMANVINFVLDPVLIFGLRVGDIDLVPAFGATGAAAATAGVCLYSVCARLGRT